VSFPGLSLEGKVAVVAGGTSGIGLALVRGLAEAGADVVPLSRRREQVEAAATEVEALGRRSLRVTADVTDRASLLAARDHILAGLGHVDVLVNCAGITKRTKTLELQDAEWSSILETNLTGTLRACQVFGEPMLAQGRGRIVNIGSLSSFVGLLEVAAYTASKSAVAGLTRALAVEWGPQGVNVNAIAPGVFRTPLNSGLLDGTERGREFLLRTPLRRFGRLEELQGACIFLSSDAASFVNGHVLAVDGGFLASGVNQ
jgi:NAD(P)-dependent dehydrogenase (short-subunit alcohol dehydrogenase family)